VPPPQGLKAPAYATETNEQQHKFPPDAAAPGDASGGKPKEMTFPVPDVDHGSHYRPEKPGAPGVDPELAGPKLKLPDRQHNFTGLDMEVNTELEAAKKAATGLTGPVYDVEGAAVNSFKAVIMHAEAIRTLQGPVYETDRNHHFLQLAHHAHNLKDLKAPVYDVDKQHNFDQIVKHAYNLKNLMGPVYDVDNENCKYVPELAKVPGQLATTAPVYRGVEAKNQYHPQSERPRHEESMHGPILPVESKNLYAPGAPQAPANDPIMSTPHYR